MPKRMEIELPVCPECGTVGKQLAGTYKGYCVGPKLKHHKRVRMVPVKFREVRERVSA